MNFRKNEWLLPMAVYLLCIAYFLLPTVCGAQNDKRRPATGQGVESFEVAMLQVQTRDSETGEWYEPRFDRTCFAFDAQAGTLTDWKPGQPKNSSPVLSTAKIHGMIRIVTDTDVWYFEAGRVRREGTAGRFNNATYTTNQ